MNFREIIFSVPKFREGNTEAVEILQATHENIKIRVNFWEQAIASAVIVQQPTENLLSIQVIEGYDQDNEKVDPQHFAKATTNSSGSAEL